MSKQQQPLAIHINTRDAKGRKQPLDPKTARAIAELARKIRESVISGDNAQHFYPPSQGNW